MTFAIIWRLSCYGFTPRSFVVLLLSVLSYGLVHALGLPGQGYVEQVRVLTHERALMVSGWAAPEKAAVFTTQLQVLLDGREIYRGRFDRVDRPDVVHATGRDDWMQSGFEQRIKLPQTARGTPVRLQVRMRLGSGQVLELPMKPGLDMVEIPQSMQIESWRVFALWFALALPVLIWSLGVLSRRTPKAVYPMRLAHVRRHGEAMLALAVVVSFLCLVGAGWHGSSIGLAFKATPMIQADAVPFWGEDRPVRSDEWEVLTPMLLSQSAHVPAYPVKNLFWGAEGHNMLVVGMTGVPVSHVSALAKPATWGFWSGNLRWGLAWHWWLPWFAAFLALWQVLVRLLRMPWIWAAVLAFLTVASPYAVVYSGWPAYVLVFAMTGVLGVWQLVLARRWSNAVLWGALTGWAACGFVLILYPPWLISVAYVALALLVGTLWQRRGEWQWRRVQWIGLMIALGLMVWMLGSWWRDAHDAVLAIRETVYPGQRTTETGGDVDLWLGLKGWLSPWSIVDPQSPMISADAGSYALLLPTLFIIGVFCLCQKSLQQFWQVICLFLCALWIVWFVHFGFAAALSRWTFWGFATSYRMDLALGLVQALLMAAMWRWRLPSGRFAFWGTAFTVALMMLGLWWMFDEMPAGMQNAWPLAWLFMAMVTAGLVVVLWFVNLKHVALGVLLFWTSLPAWFYNPLNVAPLEVQLRNKQLLPLEHVAVIGARTWAVMLPAVGVPVLNTVFYYPPEKLWRSLDPDMKQKLVHQRYQRLLMEFGAVEEAPFYKLSSPRLDETRVTLDPARADFSKLGLKHVLTPASEASVLARNASLQSMVEGGSVVWFSVRTSDRGHESGGIN